jgi:RNA polymerase-binding protein
VEVAVALRRASSTHERGIFAQAPARVRNDDLAGRQTVEFACPRGHDFTGLFADNADLPKTWECRQHGIEAGLKDTTHPPRPVKKHSHWDKVLERRPRTELAQLLNQQLEELRTGRLIPVEQWLAMRNGLNGDHCAAAHLGRRHAP